MRKSKKQKRKYNDFGGFDTNQKKKKNYISKRKKISDKEFYDDALEDYDSGFVIDLDYSDDD